MLPSFIIDVFHHSMRLLGSGVCDLFVACCRLLSMFFGKILMMMLDRVRLGHRCRGV